MHVIICLASCSECVKLALTGRQAVPKARAALRVHEAQLALLLRLVRSALQSPSAGSGHRLAAVDIINQLVHCQVASSRTRR
jgi:hypothetical protein